MSGAAYSVDAVVRIIVRGELVGDQDQVSGLCRRRDDGLLHDLNEFLHAQEIIPVTVNSRNGCGMFVGYFEAVDAARIQAWLDVRGVMRA